ncbi:MAG: succinylglutamate desuccinylase, partial [Candidatus Aminicenantales bacterium]
MKTGLFKFKLIAVVVFVLLIISGGLPLWQHRHYRVEVILGPGISEVKKLSDFFPAIKGSQADTKVYILRGKEPGGQVLIIGNTHSNEPEGLLSVLIMIENAVVEKGTLYLIPFFNHSGGLNTRPGEG